MPVMHPTIEHVAVVDNRYVRAAIALGWRQAEVPPDSEIRAELERAVTRKATLNGPISFDWTTDDGADIFTALLPQETTQGWMTELVSAAHQSGAQCLVATTVGSAVAVAEAAAALAAVSPQTRRPTAAISTKRCQEPPWESTQTPVVPAFPAFMAQSRASGKTTITVTGPDPAAYAGTAATLLAAVMIQQRTQSALAMQSAGLDQAISVEMVRHLHELFPAVSWRVRSEHRRGVLTLEAVYDALSTHHEFHDELALAAAKEAAQRELQEYARSPVELARALARFATLGWGQDLALDPAAQLEEATLVDIDRAHAALLRPIAEVLGRT